MKQFPRMFLVTLLLLMLALPVTPARAAGNLVGYWPLDGNANDASGNGYNGTLGGGSSWSIAHAPTSAANSGSLSVGSAGVSTPLVTTAVNNVTLAAWVNWAGVNGSDQMIIYNGNSTSNGYGLYLLSDGTLAVLIGGIILAPSTLKLTSGTWQYVAATFESGTWKLYLNGVSQTLPGAPYPLPNMPSGQTAIGGFGSGGGPAFSGLMDVARIYDRVLTAVELTPPPTVTAFTATSPASSFTLSIPTFTASGAATVNGYLITESSTLPLVSDPGWTGTAPTTFTVTSAGTHTLYPWAKDANGNISGLYDTPATVSVTAKPTVTTDAATLISNSGATLNGTVNANNDDATVTFEYGLTTSYGTIVVASPSPATGTTSTTVSKVITGLNANTTYHYRVVGVNSVNRTNGSDLTFSTLGVTLTTQFHDPAHVVIQSLTINDRVHEQASVVGNGPIAATGTVTFTAYNNPACAGAGLDAGTVSLNSGLAESTLSPLLTADGLSFQARYNGDANYPALTGPCRSISTSPYLSVLTLSVNTVPPARGALLGSTAVLTVQFSQDVWHSSTSNIRSATNPVNYKLLSVGANNKIDTRSCAGGLQPDDVSFTINSVTYDVTTYIATLNVNGGVLLPDGDYRLFICGTTSIADATGTVYLNNHLSDSVINFRVKAHDPAALKNNVVITQLPATGFAPQMTTVLPSQPPDLVYKNEGLWLEIPSLGVKQPIVGVPAASGWDVTWLGNQIGYLEGTAFPTWNGNSVLTGHVVNASGTDGPFAKLSSLSWGDQIIVHAWGERYIYEVRTVNLTTNPNATGLLSKHETRPWLTLLTCRGYDENTKTYRWRTAVRAVLVGVK